MEWVPQSAWLTKLRIDARAADLALRPRGRRDRPGHAVPLAAGLEVPLPVAPVPMSTPPWWMLTALVAALFGVPLALSRARA